MHVAVEPCVPVEERDRFDPAGVVAADECSDLHVIVDRVDHVAGRRGERERLLLGEVREPVGARTGKGERDGDRDQHR